MITFLDTLHNTLIPPDQVDGPFHKAALVRNWFTAHPRFLVVYLPPYSPFLNLFLPGDGKCMTEIHKRVYPFSKLWKTHVVDIAIDAFHGWNSHDRRYFPRCLARENIACDVDEVLSPV